MGNKNALPIQNGIVAPAAMNNDIMKADVNEDNDVTEQLLSHCRTLEANQVAVFKCNSQEPPYIYLRKNNNSSHFALQRILLDTEFVQDYTGFEVELLAVFLLNHGYDYYTTQNQPTQNQPTGIPSSPLSPVPVTPSAPPAP